MEKSISKKSSVKALVAKPSCKPPPGDKTFGVDTAIRFYALEHGDETKKWEEAEILVVYDSSLAASKQKLAKRQFPYIDMFDQEGPIVISAMHDLTVGVFEHLEIISLTDVDKRLACTQRILRGAVLKKHWEVLVTCKQSAKELADDAWTLGDMSRLSAENFWTWAKRDLLSMTDILTLLLISASN